MDEPVTFGSLLRRLRRARGLTQAALAQQAHYSLDTIKKLETGDRRPSRQLAAQLVASLALADDERALFLEVARPAPESHTAPGLPASAGRLLRGLPIPATPLIGRAQELRALTRRLGDQASRLLTLIGPPGIGKTSLALAAAGAVQGEYADGVVFVSLAPIRDPTLVLSAIAQALGVQERGERPLSDSLHSWVGGRQLLLVLDNCEHVPAAAPDIAALLGACPRLVVLATSRAALQLRGERLYPVPPLALPDLARLPPPEVLAQIPSVTLFLERAQALQPDFQLSDLNAAAVAQICARLDGLPLAIELVAARVRLLPPAELLARLGDRLTLLSNGPRDLPERQRTLRSAIAWSYDLLPPDVQALFRRLGVFVGGWTLEAAEAICGEEGAPGSAVLDGLGKLLEHSLVEQSLGEDSAPRFTMLETIREYALERLAASNEVGVIQRRHTHYYVALAETAALGLLGEEQEPWLRRLDSDYENLRLTLSRNLEPDGDRYIAVHLAGALGDYWNVRGRIREARGWLETALEASTSVEHDLAVVAARARALNQAATMAWHQGDHAQSRLYAAQSLSHFRELNDKPGIAGALHRLAVLTLQQADYVHAQRYTEESLAISQEANDKQAMCAALDILGHIMKDQGELTHAIRLHQQSVALARELNDPWGLCWRLNSLGESFYFFGESARAGACFEESLALARNHSDIAGLNWALYGLGRVACAQQEYEMAQARFVESIIAVREATINHFAIAQRLEGLAEVAAMQEQPKRALCLSGAAAAFRKLAGTPLSPVEQPLHAHTLNVARAQLSEADVAAAWAAGCALSLDQAVAYALSD